MKKIFTLSLLFVLFHILAPAQDRLPWRVNESQVKVTVSSAEEVLTAFNCIQQANKSGMNISYEEGNGFIRCYTTPDELNLLRDKGLRIEVEIDDLNAFSASFGSRAVPDGYYTVDQLNEIADSLATNFPEICTKYLVGTSGISEPIYILKISDNAATDENEPELMFDGGIHGDEIGGPENLIRLARDLCLDYGTDPEITDAVNNAETWILYCVNPYGRNFMTRYNAAGVDVNRDFGYMWNGEGGSPGLFSQPESKMIRNLMRAHNFVIHISYHSGTEFISYPWSYREDLTPDEANHNYLAQQYASNSGYSNLPLGPGYSGMYPINGASKDYGYGAPGAISWSMEISLSKQPPASQIESYYLKNKGAMLSMIYNAYTQGIHGSVSDSASGEAIAASVFVGDFFPVTTSDSIGDYHKFLVPGYYPVKIKAGGYFTGAFNVTINYGLQTTLDAQLVKGEGYFAQSLVSCYIPNNNPTDEGNTPAVIGPPDTVAYSIGRNGFVVVDMGTHILNRTGNDLKVYENDANPEGYKVYAANTPDGPWLLLGQSTATASFDLGSTILTNARYVKITDDGDGSSQVPDAGFDLDAIENLHPDTLTVGWVSGIVYNDQEPYFIIPGAIVSMNGNEVVAGDDGSYLMASEEGEFEITATAPYYTGTDTVLVSLGDTLQHDMYLQLTEAVTEIDNSNQFSISPQPAGDHITLNGPQGSYRAEIYNRSGTILHREQIELPAGGYRFQTGSFKPGLYIIRLTGEREGSVKFIVSH